MSKLSNNQGRAYEMAYLLSFTAAFKLYECSFNVVKNSSFFAAQRAWESVSQDMQIMFLESATAAINTLLDLEPIILENKEDELELLIQSDDKGEEGDVRDVLIIRHGIEWEIGLSVKHNHFAVKHSRLSKAIDFGEKWFGVPCSWQYWADIEPIFAYLEQEKRNGAKWSELPSKETDVYIPLLEAFVSELQRSDANPANAVPRKMVEYLLGQFDFYKVISINNQKITQIQTFNLRGTLNRQGLRTRSASPPLPIANLPTRMVHVGFMPGSSNTVEMYMDGGWQFSFRIHNARTKVETSLKFDIQIIGMPATIVSINCRWV